MGKENITIDYGKVRQLSADISKANGGGFDDIVADYEKLTGNMTKSAGDMLEAIKDQITAEKEVVTAMSQVCLQLVGSIDTAAQSFQNVDDVMVSRMNQ